MLIEHIWVWDEEIVTKVDNRILTLNIKWEEVEVLNEVNFLSYTSQFVSASSVVKEVISVSGNNILCDNSEICQSKFTWDGTSCSNLKIHLCSIQVQAYNKLSNSNRNI